MANGYSSFGTTFVTPYPCFTTNTSVNQGSRLSERLMISDQLKGQGYKLI